jgi:hypothetical protein
VVEIEARINARKIRKARVALIAEPSPKFNRNSAATAGSSAEKVLDARAFNRRFEFGGYSIIKIMP